MANPFTSVNCSIRYDNARIITWTMLSGANYPDDYIVQIENSRGGGEWHVLATDLRDTCAFVDSRRRNYNKRMDESYRLRLIVPCEGEEYVSEIVNAGNYKAYPYSAEAENVVTQVNESMKISGTPGVLMKRRTWGTRCPDCVDFAGQATVNEHCPRCLGTGIDGGYFPGVELTMLKDSISMSEGPSEIGYMQDETVKARCLAYPWIARGDVWCEEGTNNRYVISNITPVSSYKQTHIVYSVTMHKVELADVLHTKRMNDNVVNAGEWTSDKPARMPDDTNPFREPNAWDKLLREP